MSNRPPDGAPKMQRLHDFMVEHQMASVEEIYFLIYKRRPVLGRRRTQMAIGSYLSRYNVRGEAKILPGAVKGTYVFVEK